MVKNEQHNKKLHLTHTFIHIAKLFFAPFQWREKGRKMCACSRLTVAWNLFKAGRVN